MPPATDGSSGSSTKVPNTSWVWLWWNYIITTAVHISGTWWFTNGLQLTGNINGNATNRNNIIGRNSCVSTTGNNNVVIGDSAAPSFTGFWTILIGSGVAAASTSGAYNIAIGVLALASVTTASQNVAVGTEALQNAIGGNNTAIGHQAGQSTSTGSNNTYIGFQTGTTGNYSNSTALGAGSLINASNQIMFGTSSQIGTFPACPIYTGSTIPTTDNSTNLITSSWVKSLNYLTSSIWSSAQTITGSWDFTSGTILVPVASYSIFDAHAASTLWVQTYTSSVGWLTNSIFSTIQTVTANWIFSSLPIFQYGFYIGNNPNGPTMSNPTPTDPNLNISSGSNGTSGSINLNAPVTNLSGNFAALSVVAVRTAYSTNAAILSYTPVCTFTGSLYYSGIGVGGFGYVTATNTNPNFTTPKRITTGTFTIDVGTTGFGSGFVATPPGKEWTNSGTDPPAGSAYALNCPCHVTLSAGPSGGYTIDAQLYYQQLVSPPGNFNWYINLYVFHSGSLADPPLGTYIKYSIFC
ncbi:MAG: hypothetical protein KGJ07_03980 [Patescibacteria group bacterium]|nr:hypothetical protein [Patescibacteria group bacterium]